jgi:hypothetical protein
MPFAFMSLDTKIIPSMQVDFSVSSHKAKVEGAASQYNECGTIMAGVYQWRLRCCPTGMNDH